MRECFFRKRGDDWFVSVPAEHPARGLGDDGEGQTVDVALKRGGLKKVTLGEFVDFEEEGSRGLYRQGKSVIRQRVAWARLPGGGWGVSVARDDREKEEPENWSAAGMVGDVEEVVTRNNKRSKVRLVELVQEGAERHLYRVEQVRDTRK